MDGESGNYENHCENQLADHAQTSDLLQSDPLCDDAGFYDILSGFAAAGDPGRPVSFSFIQFNGIFSADPVLLLHFFFLQDHF